jgi:hypothetical protein
MLVNSYLIERVEDCGNGYGWSIVRFDDEFYGNCYELAVLKDGNLCYDTPVTRDVIRGGWGCMEELKEEIRCITNNE